MYCGTKIPADFTSKSNKIQISFVSDFSDAGEHRPTGFRFTYRTITSKTYTCFKGFLANLGMLKYVKFNVTGQKYW